MPFAATWMDLEGITLSEIKHNISRIQKIQQTSEYNKKWMKQTSGSQWGGAI